ncbi:MAG TPA: PAS domain S-box protein, partial [Gemmatimonadaceae bacterium]|nr:PAS domain S-box protein [Gemmatimonadaceae bacterium]
TLFNVCAEEMFGYTHDEVLGRRIDVLLPEAIGELPWTSPLLAFLRGEDGMDLPSAHLALYGQCSDGEIFAVDASVARATAWPAPGYLIVLRNPETPARSDNELRESEERFRVTFESDTIAFAIIEVTGRLRSVNKCLCELLGYTQAELLGRSLQEFAFPEDLPSERELMHRLISNDIDRYRIEKRYFHKLGHIVWAAWSVSLVRDSWGAPQYFVAHATDITSLTNAERALVERAAELERSNAVLEHFASVASHDLQAPLRTVANYTQLLAERYQAKIDERADRWIGFVLDGVANMKRLVDGLLSLARVQTEGAAFHVVDVSEIVDTVWHDLGAQPPARGALLTRGVLPSVVADCAQMKQLFENLLGNAIRYRRFDVPLRIDVAAERRQVDACAEWEFTVADNGIGLDMIHSRRIFENFQRAASEVDQSDTGIGLAMCERIVRRHSGRIWVESEVGRGARFHFTLAERKS